MFKQTKSRFKLILLSLAAASGLSIGAWSPNGGLVPEAEAIVQSSVTNAVSFSCRDAEATIRSKRGATVGFGQSRIYIGYQQVTATNQNPIAIRFDNGKRTWCHTDYEVTADDSRGYGLLWDGQGVMYAVFSSTGTQGSASQDFRRFASRGWLQSYGRGGGAKVAILARVNPTNGNVNFATFLSSILSSGRTNSLAVTALSFTSDRLVVSSSAFFAPRRADRQRMNCTGSSPFNYRVEFNSNLQSIVRATADRCS
jgi:hypothetical protein